MRHIINFHEISRSNIPNYYDYAYVVEAIKQTLQDQFQLAFKMYTDEETRNEIWEVLDNDLIEKRDDVHIVAHIFDSIETSTISSNHSQSLDLIVKPRVINTLYYYPEFQVALAQIPIFQNHSEMNHDFIFGTSDENVLLFLQYILKRKREYTKNNVTIFTDTEDGVENSTEKISSMVTREEVFLEEKMKKEIYRSIDEFFNESGSFFKQYHIPYKRGILLYGKPGNGKTTLVKSIANSISAPVAYWQITEYTSSYSIREVFSTAAKLAPMVLVIEDIDSMPEHVRSVFLNTLDGATSKEGIFLIGTTNYPDKIDPALINRAGRFDRAYEIHLPTPELRHQYLLRKEIDQFIHAEDLERVIQSTNDFSFAQLNELYTSIALQWHYEHKVDVDALCKQLRSDNKRAANQSWESKLNSQTVGFRF
ncbi:AAA family ATPase [Bacillus lacus]|uniref:AAA family ATPase n=1 Tax=Metabacillus lacus TaxID=1983721 RepID=A0A7X2LYY4_9BACI|nr:ATP-binding protein [Metabacillus lacus]MRX74060.1 AAA family ATPase [Metabacillus lacus]